MRLAGSSSFVLILVGFWRSLGYIKATSIPVVVEPSKCAVHPVVVNTWPFVEATEKAWAALVQTDDPIEAVVAGCQECQDLRCDGTVGYGGSPDEYGESTLDAVIMDGDTHDAGAVASLKRIKNAIGVARAVMRYTKHTMLVGEAATQFAIDMGFRQEDLHAPESMNRWLDWYNNDCQPNFRINVMPDPLQNCGPYKPLTDPALIKKTPRFNEHASSANHDTIGMIAINSKGSIAGGTSTNGASHKVPGRVGDSPIIGSGVYVDKDVGAACGTGDGDTLMKFLPSYQAVESMRNGKTASQAAEDAVRRISKVYPNYVGAIVAIDRYGNHGAGCHGMPTFKYSFRNGTTDGPQVQEVPCV